MCWEDSNTETDDEVHDKRAAYQRYVKYDFIRRSGNRFMGDIVLHM